MIGPADDASFGMSDELMQYDDLEILEEYLGGVPLPPLEVSAPDFTEQALPVTESFTVAAAEPDAAEALAFEEPTKPSFTTSTMAEIYVSQGFIQRAIDIYEEMLTESPLNEGIIQRLSELQDMLMAAPQEAAVADEPVAGVAAADAQSTAADIPGANVVDTLQTWLDNINRRR